MSRKTIPLPLGEAEILHVERGRKFFMTQQAEAYLMKGLGERYFNLTFSQGGIDLNQARKIVAFEKQFSKRATD